MSQSQYRSVDNEYITELDTIVCPYCYNERDAIWDDSEGAPFEGVEFQCGKCDKYFEVDCQPETEFWFSTKRVSQEDA